jgi:hypothetical protein
MAEFMIIVVPQDREFVPGQSAIDSAVSLLEQFFPDREGEVRHEIAKAPKLVTTRDAFESLTCPACGEAVERFELEEDDNGETWWDQFEQELYDSTDAVSEMLDMPCCGARVRAGDLDLGSDGTFVRFVLSINNPGDEVELSSKQAKAIAGALGCEIRSMTGVNS